tara:strand:- start:105310 stop:106212 length:903 start_codon:yes stop_codon:yes gene_type:complete
MIKSILVTGCQGQLGRCLVRKLGGEAIGLTRSACDLTNRQQVAEVVSALRPRIVINTAAYTNVDRAEEEAQSCHSVNVKGVEYLADACNQVGARLFQVSTDYVFGGDKQRDTPYCEEDRPAPLGVYATSKLQGEIAAKAATKHCIVRTCGLYDAPTDDYRPKNFCDTMIRLAAQHERIRVVDDQQCNPSYVPDVADAIIHLARLDENGIFHAVNGPPTTWFSLAKYLLSKVEPNVVVEPITSEQFSSPVKRPSYSVLSTKKLDTCRGVPMRSWKNAVDEYLSRRSEQENSVSIDQKHVIA